jgi:hypothetical protein
MEGVQRLRLETLQDAGFAAALAIWSQLRPGADPHTLVPTLKSACDPKVNIYQRLVGGFSSGIPCPDRPKRL